MQTLDTYARMESPDERSHQREVVGFVITAEWMWTNDRMSVDMSIIRRYKTVENGVGVVWLDKESRRRERYMVYRVSRTDLGKSVGTMLADRPIMYGIRGVE